MENSIREMMPRWWRNLEADRKTRLARIAGLVCLAIQLAIQLAIAAARLAGGENLTDLAAQGGTILMIVPLFLFRFEEGGTGA